jgi:hypothetical protein
MRSQTLAVGAVAGALAIGGTAMAAAGGDGPLGFIKGDRDRQDAQLAKDLASKLNGPSADQIQKALGQVRDERMAKRRKQEAAAIAAELDGVSTGDVDKALQKLEAKRERSGPPSGRDPRRFRMRRDGFAADLAKELGKSTASVRKALQAARKKQFESMVDQAVKDGRLTKAQADRIKKRFENGPRLGRRFHGHGHGHGPDGPGPGFGPPPGAGFAPGGGPPPQGEAG